MVVLIHTSTFLPYSGQATFWNYYWYRFPLDLAVPFFFFASGFLLHGKTPRRMVRSAGKIFTLYLAASLFYILLGLICITLDSLILDESFSSQLDQLFDHWTVREFLQGTLAQGHLWFLTALLGSTLLIALALKCKTPPSLILGIAGVFWASQICGIFENTGLVSNGGLPKGLFFVALGLVVAFALNNQPDSAKLFNWAGSAGLLTIGIYSALNMSGLPEYTWLPFLNAILLAVATAGIGTWAAQSRAPVTPLSRLAAYSLTVYVLHMAFINIVNRAFTYTGADLSAVRQIPGYPLIVTALIVGACIAVHRPFSAYVTGFSKILPPYRRSH